MRQSPSWGSRLMITAFLDLFVRYRVHKSPPNGPNSEPNGF
jgi:hypothetical protein